MKNLNGKKEAEMQKIFFLQITKLSFHPISKAHTYFTRSISITKETSAAFLSSKEKIILFG